MNYQPIPKSHIFTTHHLLRATLPLKWESNVPSDFQNFQYDENKEVIDQSITVRRHRRFLIYKVRRHGDKHTTDARNDDWSIVYTLYLRALGNAIEQLSLVGETLQRQNLTGRGAFMLMKRGKPYTPLRHNIQPHMWFEKHMVRFMPHLYLHRFPSTLMNSITETHYI